MTFQHSKASPVNNVTSMYSVRKHCHERLRYLHCLQSCDSLRNEPRDKYITRHISHMVEMINLRQDCTYNQVILRLWTKYHVCEGL